MNESLDTRYACIEMNASMSCRGAALYLPAASGRGEYWMVVCFTRPANLETSSRGRRSFDRRQKVHVWERSIEEAKDRQSRRAGNINSAEGGLGIRVNLNAEENE